MKQAGVIESVDSHASTATSYYSRELIDGATLLGLVEVAHVGGSTHTQSQTVARSNQNQNFTDMDTIIDRL
jgi:hypothetical protein